MSLGPRDIRVTITRLARLIIWFLTFIAPVLIALINAKQRKDLKHNQKLWISLILTPLAIGLLAIILAFYEYWLPAWLSQGWTLVIMVLGIPISTIVAIVYLAIEQRKKLAIKTSIITIVVLLSTYYITEFLIVFFYRESSDIDELLY